MTDPIEVNRRFYDTLWSEARFVGPERFNTWPLVSELARGSGARLEIGAGLRPRLPLSGTSFADASRPAIDRLKAAGGRAVVADAAALPFSSGCFGLVAAFDLIEHIPDDRATLAEIRRVLADDGSLLCAVPLHKGAWTDFDDFVGHFRRYDPMDLVALLAEHDLEVEKSADYGMQPKSTWLLRLGMHMLTKHRKRAMRWYNGLLMPLAVRFQKPLRFEPGLPAAPGVDEVVLLCRSTRARSRQSA
jgi:SAM-dependent methyltransferase